MTAYLAPLQSADARGVRRKHDTGTLGDCFCQGAARRQLSVNKRTRRYRQGAGRGGISHPHANRSRKLRRIAPGVLPYVIGPRIGERDKRSEERREGKSVDL